MKTRITDYTSPYTGNTSYYVYFGSYCGDIARLKSENRLLFGANRLSNAETVKCYLDRLLSLLDISRADNIWLNHLGGCFGFIHDVSVSYDI